MQGKSSFLAYYYDIQLLNFQKFNHPAQFLTLESRPKALIG
jgi:hypothetical protein